jgi:hypothetical protein
MNPNDPLPPHANAWAVNQSTGEVRAVQVVDGKCFYCGDEETEVVELGPEWKPVKESRFGLIILVVVAVILVGITYLMSKVA